MPKKSGSAHGNAQRNRTRTQKSVQLVRHVTAVAENESEIRKDAELEDASTITEPATPAIIAEVDDETVEEVDVAPSRGSEPAKSAKAAKIAKESAATAASTAVTTPVSSPSTPRSASARMAARRQQQTAQKTRQAANLVTAEHYAYVRRDLIFIAILAIIMFGTLVVLHFVPAIGG